MTVWHYGIMTLGHYDIVKPIQGHIMKEILQIPASIDSGKDLFATSVSELRRKAQEHSAALWQLAQSVQQQQQQHLQQQQEQQSDSEMTENVEKEEEAVSKETEVKTEVADGPT
jgi:ABC-type uncharacterized transport system ATPase subunit